MGALRGRGLRQRGAGRACCPLARVARQALRLPPALVLLSCGELPPTPTPELLLSWELRPPGLDSSLRGLSALDSLTAWVSGTGGRYAFTRDGGATWEGGVVPEAESLDFRDVEAFFDGTACLMSAGPGPLSRIYRTRDWGASWTLQHLNPLEEGFFNGFAFWSRAEGALVGDPVGGRLFVLLTEDGGGSWVRLEGTPPVEEGEYGFAASGTGVALFGSHGLAVATGGSAARVFLSPDRGRIWEIVSTPVRAGAPSRGIFSVAFRDSLHAMAVGGDYQAPELTGANVALSSDGGRSWTLAPEPHGVGYRSGVTWRDDAELPLWLAVGTTGSSFSRDGGLSWVTFDTLTYHAVASAGSTVWAAGPQGRVARLLVSTSPTRPGNRP